MRKERGVLLVTVLLVSLVISVFVGAVIKIGPVSLAGSSNLRDSQAALLAAQAGLEYARARLREDSTWRGSADSGPNFVVRAADSSITVVEDHGNVIGLLIDGEGRRSQFRIRFNHHDGSGGTDGLDEPSSAYRLQLPVVSQNNIQSATPAALWKDSGGSLQEQAERLTEFQARIAVEGRAGTALRTLSPDAPNATEGPGRLSSRLLEARLAASYSQSLDAVAMAAGNFEVNLAPQDDTPRADKDQRPHRLEVAAVGGKDSSPPRVRSKTSIGVNGYSGSTNYSSPNGFTNTPSGSLLPGTNPNDSLTQTTEASGDSFYQLTWDEVTKADPSAGDTVTIKAGTYVATGDQKLLYFDMPYEEYHRQMKDPNLDPGPGLELSRELQQVRPNYGSEQPNGIVAHQTKDPTDGSNRKNDLQLLVRQDIHIEPTTATDSFTYISERGPIDAPPATEGELAEHEFMTNTSSSSGRITLQFLPPANKSQVTLSSEGQVLIGAKVYGDGGAITSARRIDLVGTGGAFESGEVSEGVSGVSLYSKGDIRINSYRPSWTHNQGKYSDLAINGVIYSWGDVKVEFGKEPGDSTPDDFFKHHGYFRLKGAVVAYGSDPGDAGSGPGTGTGNPNVGLGNITINAAWSRLVFDPSYVGGLNQTAVPDNLRVLSWSIE